MIKQLIDRYRKPKLVFESLIPGVERLMPIVEAKDVKYQWVNKALEEYRQDHKKADFGMNKYAHTARCPGIFSLQRRGWIQRTWQDVTIETYGDGSAFNWTSPIDQNQLNPQMNPYVGFHDTKQLADYMNNWPSNTLRTIIKINSPWKCFVPRGYVLLEMPVAYSDENRFTTLPGFFSHEHGPAPLNTQLMWHVMEGKTLIKAGTPIAQYILMPKDKYESEVRSFKHTNHHEFQQLLDNHRFVKNYAEVRKIYK